MRKWLRKWLGIEDLEHKFVQLLVEFGNITPAQAEEIISEGLNKDFKLENNHGEEGQL